MMRQKVSEFMSYKVRDEQKNKLSNTTDIFAYPQNDVRDIAKIMADIRIDCLPVLASPWDKKLAGFIELSKIRIFLND